MQFLKTLFWFLLALIAVVFAFGNWTTVQIKLWAGLIAEINLPLLLVVTFLAGLLPMLAFHHAVKWRLRQKLATSERAIADLRGLNSPAAAAVTQPAETEIERPIPPASVPMAVPPGVA